MLFGDQVSDDPRLTQGSTTTPPLMCVQDWPVEAACVLGFCGWQGDGLETVAEVEGQPVVSALDGLLRGLLADDVEVEAGVKVGDVDPRGRAVDPYRISEKGRAIAAGTLEAILLKLAVLKAP